MGTQQENEDAMSCQLLARRVLPGRCLWLFTGAELSSQL